MSTTLRFRNHHIFHRTSLYLAFAGPLAALAASALPGGPALIVAMAALATTIAIMAATGGSGLSRIFGGGAVAALGGATLVASTRWGSGNVGPLLFSLIVALPMATGLRGRRLLLSVIAGSAALLLARFTAVLVLSSSDLSSLPSWGSSALSGLAVSAASVLALLPRHLDLSTDRVAAIHAKLRLQAKGEIAELVERGHSLWTQAKLDLEEHNANRVILEEAVLRLMQTAQRWSDATAHLSSTSADKLAERMESLADRIAEADDEVVIQQYQLASAALAEQSKYLCDIGKNRERVLARMHNYLAAMERLRLAVANLESTNASREAVDLAPMVESLEELGQDIDSCSLALRELRGSC